MKHLWKRIRPIVDLDQVAITEMIRPAFPRSSIVGFQQIASGLANTIYHVQLSGPIGSICLKIGQRGMQQSAMEVRVLKRVAAILRAPRVYYFAESSPICRRPYALMEWVCGRRLDAQPRLRTDQQIAGSVARALGTMLAQLHQIRFPNSGLVEFDTKTNDLQVVTKMQLDAAGMHALAQENITRGPGYDRIGQQLTNRLMRWLETSAVDLLSDSQPSSLCHGDYGTENILMVPNNPTSLCAIDWEFAFSGNPLIDLGHLLRDPFLPEPVFEAHIATGYRDAGGSLPEDWIHRARAHDLGAWIVFLGEKHLSAEAIACAVHAIERVLTDNAQFNT